MVGDADLPCQTNDEGSKGLGSPISEDFLTDGSQSGPHRWQSEMSMRSGRVLETGVP